MKFVCLKFYANDLIFLGVMATFVLLHKSFSLVHKCICLTLGLCSMYRRKGGASLIEISEGMSELSDD